MMCVISPSSIGCEPSTVGVSPADSPTIAIETAITTLQSDSRRLPIHGAISPAVSIAVVLAFVALLDASFHKSITATRRLAGDQTAIVVRAVTIITRFVSSLPSLKVDAHQAIATAGKDTAANAVVHIA